jgi:LDH2 family malate/lactate/ureidoglycolate dehydrogenase
LVIAEGVLVCPTAPRGRTCEIRLTGEISRAEVDAVLAHVDLVQHEATTVVRGSCAGQAALQRALRLARTYGLDIVEIRRISHTGAVVRVKERI